MSLWPYGTKVRAGAPATVNLAGEAMDVFFSGTPLQWAAPIYAIWHARTIDTAELCATDPPPDEHWNANDIAKALDSSQVAFIDAKLDRMARANIWPTYCEYIEPQETTTYSGRPRYIGAGAISHTLSEFNGTFDDDMLAYDEADFYVVTVECTTPPSDSGTAWLEVPRPDDWTGDPAAQPAYFPNADIGVSAYFVPKRGPIYNVLTGFVELEPNIRKWRFHSHTSGVWQVAISAWALDLDPIPVPEPWQLAPAEPFIGPCPPEKPYQFTDDAAENLTDWGGAWGTYMDSIFDSFQDVLNAIAAIDIPGAPVGGFTILPPEAGQLTGSNVLNIQPEMCGIGIYVNPPDYIARRGVEPLAMFDVGHYALGAPNGWLTSVALKHSPHLVYPFPDGITRIAIDLPPGVWVEYFWLQKMV